MAAKVGGGAGWRSGPFNASRPWYSSNTRTDMNTFCASLPSVAVWNTKSESGREVFISSYIIKGSQGRILEERLKQRSAYWLASTLIFIYLSCTIQDHHMSGSGTTIVVLALLHQLAIKKMPYRHTNLVETILQLRFLLLGCLWLMSGWQKSNQHIISKKMSIIPICCSTSAAS